MIYVERTLHNGKLRRGLVGMVDLEQYDYEPGSPAQVRATEGTESSPVSRPEWRCGRTPPLSCLTSCSSLTIRSAPSSSPWPGEKAGMEQVYDFDLMEQGGHLAGWKLGRGAALRRGRRPPGSG